MKRFPFSYFVSPLIGFFVCLVIIFFFAKNPQEAVASFFLETFSNKYYFGSMLNTATFLMIAGVGQCIALRSGNMNLGGEGQIYVGGYITAAMMGMYVSLPPALVFVLTLLVLFVFSSAIASVSAGLKEARGAEVLLTSFLLSSSIIPLIDGLITAKNNNSGQNLLALPYINERFRFRQLLAPSAFNATFFVALFICFFVWIFFTKTFAGRRMYTWGMAPQFAHYCGYSSIKNTFFSLTASCVLHTLTGMVAVCGTYYTCHKDFYVGMGWNALSCALIASSKPLVLIPVSIFLAWLYTSADRVALTQGFSFDISGIVQGCILFAIAIPFSIKQTRKEQ